MKAFLIRKHMLTSFFFSGHDHRPIIYLSTEHILNACVKLKIYKNIFLYYKMWAIGFEIDYKGNPAYLNILTKNFHFQQLPEFFLKNLFTQSNNPSKRTQAWAFDYVFAITFLFNRDFILFCYKTKHNFHAWTLLINEFWTQFLRIYFYMLLLRFSSVFH
jgi:hypothetical protein